MLIIHLVVKDDKPFLNININKMRFSRLNIIDLKTPGLRKLI
jgi:hypothetical protein